MTAAPQMNSTANIQSVHAQELDAFLDHLIRHAPASDHDGAPTTPQLAGDRPTREQLASRLGEGWARPLEAPAWIRSWALRDEAQFVGHIQLQGGRFRSDLHRATLIIGLEVAYRARGYGRLLLETALRWSRETPLEWIDLGVFSDNLPALRLYERFGFTGVGRIADRFRLHGKKIDEIQMTLRL